MLNSRSVKIGGAILMLALTACGERAGAPTGKTQVNQVNKPAWMQAIDKTLDPQLTAMSNALVKYDTATGADQAAAVKAAQDSISQVQAIQKNLNAKIKDVTEQDNELNYVFARFSVTLDAAYLNVRGHLPNNVNAMVAMDTADFVENGATVGYLLKEFAEGGASGKILTGILNLSLRADDISGYMTGSASDVQKYRNDLNSLKALFTGFPSASEKGYHPNMGLVRDFLVAQYNSVVQKAASVKNVSDGTNSMDLLDAKTIGALTLK